MNKEIKDYLHLYLGCELFTGTGVVILVAVQIEKIPCTDFKVIVLNGNVVYSSHYQNYKPLLRPLSDMTEEEMNECGNLCYDFSDDDELNKWDVTDFNALLMPEQFLWLLSKHFDLFGLHEAGLAIDVKTLK